MLTIRDSKLALVNPEIVNKGYDENDFDEEYWTRPQANGAPSRMCRDATHLIDYIKDVFKIFMDACEIIDRSPIIDIGAGAGNIVHDFRKAGFDVDGCEFSASGRKIAKEKFNVDLDYCDLREVLPYCTDTYDWGMCVGVPSMIPRQHLKHAIQEIFRVVKYGVLINVQSFNFNEQPISPNLLHLSGMSTKEWWKLFNDLGIVDLTSIIPQQKEKYRMAILDEFAGLFVKKQNLKNLFGGI